MAPPRRASAGRPSYAISDDDDDLIVGAGMSTKTGSTTKRSAKSSAKKATRIVDSDSEFEEEGDGSEAPTDDDAFEGADSVDAEEEDEDVEMSLAQDDNSEAHSDDLIISDVEEVKPKPRAKAPARKKSVGGKGKGPGEKESKTNLDESLPPIHNLDEIFQDLVSRVDLSTSVKKLNGRPLRVGTMCSGTESPLLALDIVSRVLEESTGQVLKIEHVFSCEIEPFKQAYIERNFQPPLLFRDITDLGEDEAETAYGGIQKVPGGVDLIVAGTSCVDYSNLNSEKKGISGGGESGQTFFGMLDYVKRHCPSIVILENVSGAPWKKCIDFFAGIGYTAQDIHLDTKRYYIPHTRSRGYLIAVPTLKSKLPSKWHELLKSLERPASSPLESFLLPSDDPRITRARMDLKQKKVNADGSARAATDWNKCEARHALERNNEALGNKRPLTLWQEGGGPPTMYNGAWQDWGQTQTERVLDLCDISVLRPARYGVDINYKSAVWNLSQNVDRTTASNHFGICPCLTPNMIPYLTSRGGPILGIEALALQGLPIDTLMLTRESQDQMADLAGNAMSSAVVGAAILAALNIAGHTLPEGEQEVDVKVVEVRDQIAADSLVTGEERLEEVSAKLSSCSPVTDGFLERAQASARKCDCEGRTGTTDPTRLHKCTTCPHFSCDDCLGRPTHNLERDATPRHAPHEFENEFKSVLPMRFTLAGFSKELLDAEVAKLRDGAVPVNEKWIDAFVKTVSEAVDTAEFRFRFVRRRRNWSALFSAPNATLELTLHAEGPRWRLYIEPAKSLPVKHQLREIFKAPVATLSLGNSFANFVEGAWLFNVPLVPQDITLKIEHGEERVSSWRNGLGLVAHQDDTRSTTLRITSTPEHAHFLERPIDGLYTLQPECGTACDSLYLRTEPMEERPLYFFFDPSRFSGNEFDFYVFSEDCSRLEHQAHRPVIAQLRPAFRPQEFSLINPSAGKAEQTTVFGATSMFSRLDESKIVCDTKVDESATLAMPQTALALKADAGACSQAQNLLVARIPATAADTQRWWTPSWTTVDVLHEGPELFKDIAWTLARLHELASLREWQSVDPKSLHEGCSTCCPPPPAIQFRMTATRSIVAHEDGHEAAQFERALKARPAPITVQTRLHQDNIEFRIGLNVATLAHRAICLLPTDPYRAFITSDLTVSWRLRSEDNLDLSRGKPLVARKFRVPNNNTDPQANQPPGWVVKLRPEQLRSLTWMLRQENDPTPWIEEETAEAIIDPIGWHAEVKATRSVSIRGGVVADEVGYGKTAITVALVSQQLATFKSQEDPDRIVVKATLIVVPPHLMSQWPKEIAKFTGQGLKVLSIPTVGAQKKVTIKDIMSHDIVLVTAQLFNSDSFWPYMGDFCASPRGVGMDAKAGRYFRSCVNEAVDGIAGQLALLRDPAEGPKAVFAKIRAARKARKAIDIPLEAPRRLKGTAYAYANSKKFEEDARELAAKSKTQGAKPKAPPKQKRTAAPKAVKAIDVDSWELSSLSANHWKSVKNPPLSIFSFARIVIDEYTYLEPIQLVALRSIRASNRWILSGTPPTKDFTTIKTIANLLHVHLGIDDEMVGAKKGGRGENTAAEDFHSFRDVHTVSWHVTRDAVCQKFLDQFARQNLAEIGDIPWREVYVLKQQSPPERAVYCELEHYCLNQDQNLLKVAKIDSRKRSDRELRMSEALGDSKSPDEALLKRSSHFSVDMEGDAADLDTAVHVCDQINNRRIAQMTACKVDLEDLLRTCVTMHHALAKGGYFGSFSGGNAEPLRLKEWLNQVYKGHGDTEADKEIRLICEKLGSSAQGIGKLPSGSPAATGLTAFNACHGVASHDEHRKVKLFYLRENVHILRRLSKELVQRVRSQRYFQRVWEYSASPPANAAELGLLSSCGHTGSLAEVEKCARELVCVEPGCNAQVRSNNVVKVSSFSREADSKFGTKIQTIINLISTIPKDERILVFVQFEDLLEKVREGLMSYGIPTMTLDGTALKKSANLDKFQNPESEDTRVLLLHVTDSSASGANLTIANHAVFVHPLLTDTQENYDAFETQAIGRVRRFGQERPVKIYRMLMEETIDVSMIERRAHVNVAEKVAAQEVEDPLMTQYPPTTKKFREVDSVKQTKGATLKSKVKVTKKGKPISDDSEEDDDEESAASTDDEVMPVKKKQVAAPKRKRKAAEVEEKDARPKRSTHSKVIIVDSDEDEENESEVALPPAKKIKHAPSPNAKEKVVASPVIKKAAVVPSSSSRPKSAVQSAPTSASRVIKGVNQSAKIAPLFANMKPKATSSPAPAPLATRQTFAVQVAAFSPKKRAHLKSLEAAAKIAKATAGTKISEPSRTASTENPAALSEDVTMGSEEEEEDLWA